MVEVEVSKLLESEGWMMTCCCSGLALFPCWCSWCTLYVRFYAFGSICVGSAFWYLSIALILTIVFWETSSSAGHLLVQS